MWMQIEKKRVEREQNKKVKGKIIMRKMNIRHEMKREAIKEDEKLK